MRISRQRTAVFDLDGYIVRATFRPMNQASLLAFQGLHSELEAIERVKAATGQGEAPIDTEIALGKRSADIQLKQAIQYITKLEVSEGAPSGLRVDAQALLDDATAELDGLLAADAPEGDEEAPESALARLLSSYEACAPQAYEATGDPNWEPLELDASTAGTEQWVTWNTSTKEEKQALLLEWPVLLTQLWALLAPDAKEVRLLGKSRRQGGRGR